MTDPSGELTLDRYHRLIELSLNLASTLDLSELLNRIVHAAADLCLAEAASILLYDQASHQLYFEAATNMETPLMRGLNVPVGNSIAGLILTKREPMIVSDAQKDPRHFKRIGQATKVQTESILGVPLIAKDKVIGVLEAINKRSGEFSVEDQFLLAALGAQAALAIENARLFQQSDLISEMVHELRTPLASLHAVTHLLLRPEIKEEQRTSLVDTMQREINRLTEMSTSFLDLARLESGRSHFHVEQVDIENLLSECAQVMGSKAEEKRINFQVRLSLDLPVIMGDTDKLKQVILNLLSNAIKFTPTDGKIVLAARSEADRVIIQISDNGVGIPPGSLPHIFEKFYRVPETAQSAPGTGLGLSICKRIIEAHKGTIEVESGTGTGATFTVFIPVSGTK